MPIRKWKLPREIAHLRYPGPKDLIVAAPVKPGLQSCIIREVKPGYEKIREVKDALVNVPVNCPLMLEPYPDPEFAGYLGIANEQYKKDIRRASKRSSSAALSRSPQQSSVPDIIKVGEAKANPRWKEHWLIVKLWTGWEMGGMTLSQRFDQHCWYQGKIPPPKGAVREKKIQRFRAICRTINLGKNV